MNEGGRNKGVINVKKFEDFIQLHERLNDWDSFLNANRTKLRRQLISKECGFSNSAFSQNPLLIKMLIQLEAELFRKGVIEKSNEELEILEYENQSEFIKVYSEKLCDFKHQLENVAEKIYFYQSELEKMK